MSATIDSSGIMTGVAVDVVEVSVDSPSAIGGAGAETEGVGGEAGKGDSHVGDAADFLLSNPKYHDCFMNVGNPGSEKVERIGVISTNLIAHSPEFKAMLENRQADLPIANINITDVSPATFKSMLRFVYGAKLPQLAPIEAAALALCAEKYKIARLAQKALKRVIPTSAQDVFPALVCVTFASFPDLQIQVCNIIQEETDMIVQQSDFLKLSEECMIFILQQEKLNIDELELWKHVVRWAEHQSTTSPGRTVRDCLAKILGHIRLLTLTLEEIAKYILPTKILTPEEFMDLILAVTKNLPLESPILCKIPEKRNLQEEDLNVNLALNEIESNASDVDRTFYEISGDHVKECCKSVLKIKPTKPVEILSFTCASMFCWDTACTRTAHEDVFIYNSSCKITIKKIVENVVVTEKVKNMPFAAPVCSVFFFVPKLEKGKSIMLMPGETLVVTLEFEDPHPVHDDKTENSQCSEISVEVEDYSHVRFIEYMNQE